MQPTRREVVTGLGASLVCAAVTGSGRSKKIKIGQIGVGHAHASKLSVYRQSADYEVVGIVEADEKLRRQAKASPTYQGLHWLDRQ